MREVDLYSGNARANRPAGRPGPAAFIADAATLAMLKSKLDTQTEALDAEARAAALLNARLLLAQNQLDNAERELELQKQARASDVARMTWRLSRFQDEEAVVAAHALAERSSLRRQRNICLAIAVAGIVALSILCVVGWRTTVLAPIIHAPRIEAHAAGPPNLAQALDDLNKALAAVPGRGSPEEILRKVSSSGGVSANEKQCRILWTNDLPSLLFSGTPLAETLENCARAVSRVK